MILLLMTEYGDRRVRIIGSGSREHALLNLAKQSPQISYIDITPGNGGTEAYNVSISATDIKTQVEDAKARHIDTVIVGPEDPLALGIRDRMNAVGIDVFGPTAQEAMIESSKWFAIELMRDAGVRHPETQAFYDFGSARAYVMDRGFNNIVLKRDGLLGGKGVSVPDSLEEAEVALINAFRNKTPREPILVQNRIEGVETSFMAFVDGEHIVPLLSSRDYKRVGEGDSGPNTGGMGAIAPDKTATAALHKRIMKEIMYPIVLEMRKRGMRYRGILYAGLMIDEDGNPIVIEFNSRGGDPELPVISILFSPEFDILEVIDAVKNGTLSENQLRFLENMFAVGIVASSKGYPGKYDVGKLISGLDQKLDDDSFLFHAGTKIGRNGVYTNGGRVVLAVGRGESFKDAKKKATNVISKVIFEGKHQRNDIGDF